MAKRLLLVAVALTAFLAVPMQAEAATAGFCAFGICAGVAAAAPTGFVFVQACANVAIGCQTQIVPHGQPVAVPSGGICQTVFVPPGMGLPDVPVVVQVCA